MTPDQDPQEPIEPELVAQAPPEAREASPGPGTKTFFHPWSGVVILGVDWLAFGIEAPTGLVLQPLMSVLAFGLVFMAVAEIQFRLAKDTPAAARWKALLGGLAAGVPFPVTGTIIGAAILMLSGLPTLRKR